MAKKEIFGSVITVFMMVISLLYIPTAAVWLNKPKFILLAPVKLVNLNEIYNRRHLRLHFLDLTYIQIDRFEDKFKTLEDVYVVIDDYGKPKRVTGKPPKNELFLKAKYVGDPYSPAFKDKYWMSYGFEYFRASQKKLSETIDKFKTSQRALAKIAVDGRGRGRLVDLIFEGPRDHAQE